VFNVTSVILLLGLTLFIEAAFRERLFRSWRERLIWVAIFLVIGGAWDSYSIAQGHWAYPQDQVIGIFFGVMPLEDVLWLLIVPYFCITVYKVIHLRLRH
jgi:lycopene cyclase domain-containing protein